MSVHLIEKGNGPAYKVGALAVSAIVLFIAGSVALNLAVRYNDPSGNLAVAFLAYVGSLTFTADTLIKFHKIGNVTKEN